MVLRQSLGDDYNLGQTGAVRTRFDGTRRVLPGRNGPRILPLNLSERVFCNLNATVGQG